MPCHNLGEPTSKITLLLHPPPPSITFTLGMRNYWGPSPIVYAYEVLQKKTLPYTHVVPYGSAWSIPQDQALMDIVLKSSWICSTNFGLDWASQQYNLHVNSTSLTGPSAAPSPSFQKVETIIHTHDHASIASMVWIADT